MYRSLLFTIFTLSTAFGAPTEHTRRQRLTVASFDGETVPNSYIVKLKPNVTPSAQLAALVQSSPQIFASGLGDLINDGIDKIGDIVGGVLGDEAEKLVEELLKKVVTHELPFIGGYAGVFSDDELNSLLEDENVEYVEANGIMHAFGTQNDATWGLQSISTRELVRGTNDADLDYTYNFDDSAGSGVDIYILDTGINVDHVDFGGRATFGFAAPSFAEADGNGHGTHCAGSAAGTQFGVAKNANLIAVKVLGDDGGGSVADIVAGIEFVVQQAGASGNPTVASMSLGGGVSQTLDTAVKQAVGAGIHFTVAAGNENQDAGNVSPARVTEAITVGAINRQNRKAGFSNFGSVVDIFAPGENIVSTWIGGNDITNTISGTSMATPHVAGLVAYLLALEGPKSPAELVARIKELATRGVITGLPTGTPNLLAFNGIGEVAESVEESAPVKGVPDKAAAPPASTFNFLEWLRSKFGGK